MELKKVMTPEFRAGFPNVFAPDEKGMYRVQMLIPKTADITELKDAVKAVMLDKWPDPEKRPKKLVHPIKDGDTTEMEDGSLRKDKYPECAGHWVINAGTKMKPGVVDMQLVPIITAEEFYGGCYAKATVHAYAYSPTQANPQKKNGIGIGLQNIQKQRDGDPFTGRSKPEDDFETGPTIATEGGAGFDDDMLT